MAEIGLPHDVRGQAMRPRAERRGLWARISRWLEDRRNRALVAALGDEQLRDAGIDLAVAGRGRSVAVDPLAALTLAGMAHTR